MRPITVATAAGVALCALAAAAPAHAQLSDSGGPVAYSADNLEYFDGERRLVLTGDVDIVQGDARLRADSVTLFFGASANPNTQGLGAGDIERMIAVGEVYYVRPAQSARGDRAVYEVAQDAVTFSGNVVLASDSGLLRYETMTFRIRDRTATLPRQPGQRVRGVFVPRGGQQNSGQSGQ